MTQNPTTSTEEQTKTKGELTHRQGKGAVHSVPATCAWCGGPGGDFCSTGHRNKGLSFIRNRHIREFLLGRTS